MKMRFACSVVCLFVTLGVISVAEAAPKKKKKGTTHKPEAQVVVPETKAENQIEFVSVIGTSMNSAVLLPIDRKFTRDVRADLTGLLDDLLDEAKAKPVASPETYATAVRLVDAWLAALKERETRRASMGLTPPPTTDLDHGKKTNLHFWDDTLNSLREVNDAKEKRAADKQKREFFKDADINNWRLRTDVLRPQIEALYGRFRELRRASL